MSDEWKSETPKANDDKSWKLLEKAVLAGVQEQRRARRWGIFFKSLTFIYLFVVLLAFSPFGSLEKSASRKCTMASATPGNNRDGCASCAR